MRIKEVQDGLTVDQRSLEGRATARGGTSAIKTYTLKYGPTMRVLDEEDTSGNGAKHSMCSVNGSNLKVQCGLEVP